MDREALLDVVAGAQYSVVRAVAVARGDGPVPQLDFEWTGGEGGRLHVPGQSAAGAEGLDLVDAGGHVVRGEGVLRHVAGVFRGGDYDLG